ncbi:hypothetical protein JOH50_006666 [Rhizobium leguminosarum]|uniref:hypothetical protein n=1 Tax=Rhizobium leguminosarum TaxID=384 RepID=UPI001AEA0FAD|nr:hypothetical protein [Rhizobium leguminosarum]MBP2490870.1 hypothetical protein [Rhizobium leguminosarum]
MFLLGFCRILVIAIFSLLCIFVASPLSIALADAATHDLSIKTKDYEKADCGGGTCTSECSVNAELRISKFGPATSVPIEVQIWYKTDHVESGESAISLQFDELTKGHVVTAQAQAPGYRCKQVVVKRIIIECLQNTDGKCPGFYYVQIPKVPVLKIKAQKIEGK